MSSPFAVMAPATAAARVLLTAGCSSKSAPFKCGYIGPPVDVSATGTSFQGITENYSSAVAADLPTEVQVTTSNPGLALLCPSNCHPTANYAAAITLTTGVTGTNGSNFTIGFPFTIKIDNTGPGTATLEEIVPGEQDYCGSFNVVTS